MEYEGEAKHPGPGKNKHKGSISGSSGGFSKVDAHGPGAGGKKGNQLDDGSSGSGSGGSGEAKESRELQPALPSERSDDQSLKNKKKE